MSKIVVVDGEKYVSAEEIVNAMMKKIMGYAFGDDLAVCPNESYMFEAYENLLREIGDTEIRNRLRNRYVMDRFYAKRHVE